MAENCGNCIYWNNDAGGPQDMQNMGVCTRISEGDPQAMTVDGDFLCADTFYCSLYEGSGEDETMAEGDIGGFAGPPTGNARGVGPVGGLGLA